MFGIGGKKAQAQQGPSPKVTGGRIEKVVCPHCGKTNDFRGIGPDGSKLLGTGEAVDCDHCKRIMQVVKFEHIYVVSVRQHPTKRGTSKR